MATSRLAGLVLCSLLSDIRTLPGQSTSRSVQIERAVATRRALVIGNAGYPRAPLQNTLNDARAVTSALKGAAFQVQTGEDLDGVSFDRAVDTFVRTVQNGDVALFYFSGHGIELNRENYLIPVDFKARDEAEAKRAAYPASLLLEKLEGRKPALTILILDACRNNPFRGERGGGGGLVAMEPGAGVYIAFATSPGKTASDNPDGRNGLFSGHLVTALNTPGLGLHEVFDDVGSRVVADSAGTQVPWVTSTPVGRFVFREATAPKPAPPTDPYAGIEAFRTAGKYGEMIPLLNRVILASPGDVRAYVERSNARLRTGDPKGAIEDCNSALALDPRASMAYNNRGYGYLVISDFTRAIADLSKAIELTPLDSLPYQNRALAYSRSGDRERALLDLNQSIRLRPTTDAFFQRSVIHLERKNYQQARADLDQGVRLQANHAPSYLNRGRALTFLSEDDLAIRDFNMAESLSLASLALYSWRGQAHARLGNREKALEDYGKALGLNRESTEVLNNRGYLYAQMGRCSDALNDLNRALAIKPDFAAALDSRGYAYVCLKDYAKAVPDLDRAISLRPDSAEQFLHRASAKDGLGDRTGAAADRDRASRLSAGSPLIVDFSLEPRAIRPGETATLRWSVTNASALSLNPGIGAVPSNGSRQVSPATTTSYSLSATNGAGGDQRTVTLEVSAAGAASENVAGLRTARAESGKTMGVSPELTTAAKAEPIRKTAPQYNSQDASRKGIQGKVSLAVTTNRAGQVERVRLLQGIHPELDEQAATTVKNWLWAPGPEVVERHVTIQFGSPELISRVQVSSSDQKGNLLSSTKPVFPKGVPKKATVTIQVRLEVLLGIDGRVIKVVNALEGPKEFVVPAVAAVAKWRYAPTFRDNIPVQVVTEVAIVF